MMSWTRQVWHVVRKDVWEQRWLLGLYGALLVMGVVQATASVDSSGKALLGALVVRALAAFISASIILGDSPVEARAYWASLPYARSALFAAKALFIAALLLTTAASFALPLLTLSPTGAQLAEQLVHFSAWYGALLVATVLSAAVAPNLRTVLLAFLVAAVLLPVTFLLQAGRDAVSDASSASSIPLWLLAAAMVLALAIVARRYQDRRGGRLRLAASLLASGSLLVAPNLLRGTDPTVPTIAPSRIAGVALSVQTRRPDSLTLTPGFGAVGLVVLADGELLIDDSASTSRVEVIPTTAEITTTAGDVRRVPWTTARRTVHEPALPLPASFRWRRTPLSKNIPMPSSAALASTRTSPDIQRTETLPVTRVIANAELQFANARLLARLPLRRDVNVTTEGQRISLNDFRGGENPEVEITVLALQPPGVRAPFSLGQLDGLEFVLVNPKRAEALRLTSRSTGGEDAPWMISPYAVRLISHTLTATPRITQPQDDPASTAQVSDVFDAAWLRDAELLVYSWVVTGTSPISLSQTAKQTAAMHE